MPTRKEQRAARIALYHAARKYCQAWDRVVNDEEVPDGADKDLAVAETHIEEAARAFARAIPKERP